MTDKKPRTETFTVGEMGMDADQRETAHSIQCATLRSQLQNWHSPIMIGVAGDSGSGKTTYSNGIRRLIGIDLVSTIAMDGYHKEDRDQRRLSGRLPLDPDANHLDLLRQHLQALKRGESVEIPIYNHATGKFDPPVPLSPAPIIIVEGLHALYPELLDELDFKIYVDPDHDVKWQWKFERDVKKRGHRAENLTEEMLQREAAYKRWLDFQKTNATIVIKIGTSCLQDFARHQFTGNLPQNCYKVELIVEPAPDPLPSVPLPFDLATMLAANQPPFLVAAVPCIYWGRPSTIVHIDGVLPQAAILELKNQIVDYTGIPLHEALEGDPYAIPEHEAVSATQFTQLLVTWRFLELVNARITVAPE